MGQIEFRRMDFSFDDDIPFQFNPQNIAASNSVNSLTFMAPAFETYFIKAFRDAMPLLRSERVKKDAKIFIQQERQHSKYHIAHLNMLMRKFPELEQVRDDVNASYQRLYEEHPLEYHLAYTATIELAFGPIARFLIEHRDTFFSGGDPRISSFVLWHFVEEFEHRNCAIDVFNDIVGSHFYRLRQVSSTRRHLRETAKIVRTMTNKLTAEGKIAPETESVADRIPVWSRYLFMFELLGTLSPFHKPDRLKQPEWATQWFADHAAGKPMTHAYQESN